MIYSLFLASLNGGAFFVISNKTLDVGVYHQEAKRPLVLLALEMLYQAFKLFGGAHSEVGIPSRHQLPALGHLFSRLSQQ